MRRGWLAARVRRGWRASATIVVALCCLAGESHATDRLFFARKGKLLSVNANGRGTKRIVTLAKKTRIVSLSVSNNGVVLIKDSKGKWLWVDSNKRKPVAKALACAGHATIAPNGKVVVCSGAPKVTYIHDLAGNQIRMIPTGVKQVGFKNRHSTELVAATDGKLWAIPLADWEAQRLLSPHAPVDGLLVAPNGNRAVGRYPDGKRKRIFSFRLDGKAAKRRLVRNAVPVAWSADSTWLLAQVGNMACVVRGVGGQFKCWRKFRALALSRDGATAILARRDKRRRKRVHLYKGQLKGSSAGKPYLFIRNASLAAAWQSK